MVYLSLKGKIVSFIKEKKLPWSAIVDVEKARLPSDSLATANIPLLESIGTSDMPDFSPEFILQQEFIFYLLRFTTSVKHMKRTT